LLRVTNWTTTDRNQCHHVLHAIHCSICRFWWKLASMFKPRFIRSTYPPPDKFIVIPRIFVRKEEEKKLSVVSKK